MFGEKILDYWDDILRDLKEIVAIPSVAKPQDGPYPFGKDAAAAVDKAMELCARYGLTAKNCDYYAMHAELGSGEENAVVMSHLDVVPAGEGWVSEPYAMEIRDGFAYGRGVSDNKGPAIVALHCLRALRDAGVVGKRKLRVVLGSAEEIGMQDMGYYFSKEQKPTMGFTPDASYGLCHCEKGLFRFAVTGPVGEKIKSFKAGTVVNAVPYKAEADVVCCDEGFKKLADAAAAAEIKFDVTRTADGAHIVAHGVASHALCPQNGVNAAAYLIRLLVSVWGKQCGKLLCFIDEKIGLTYDGSKIGVKMSDEPSGDLTFNLGLVEAENGEGRFDVDIRYPALKKGADIDAVLRGQIEGAGLTYILCSDEEPLYLPKDGPLVQLLSGAYEDMTGEKCDVFAMGGGTYARQMNGKGVAFGASFAGDDTNAHNCNESLNLEHYKKHAQICLEAMYRMFTAE